MKLTTKPSGTPGRTLLQWDGIWLDAPNSLISTLVMQDGWVPKRLTAEMVVAGANVEPPCSVGEMIDRWNAAIAVAPNPSEIPKTA